MNTWNAIARRPSDWSNKRHSRQKLSWVMKSMASTQDTLYVWTKCFFFAVFLPSPALTMTYGDWFSSRWGISRDDVFQVQMCIRNELNAMERRISAFGILGPGTYWIENLQSSASNKVIVIWLSNTIMPGCIWNTNLLYVMQSRVWS